MIAVSYAQPLHTQVERHVSDRWDELPASPSKRVAGTPSRPASLVPEDSHPFSDGPTLELPDRTLLPARPRAAGAGRPRDGAARDPFGMLGSAPSADLRELDTPPDRASPQARPDHRSRLNAPMPPPPRGLPDIHTTWSEGETATEIAAIAPPRPSAGALEKRPMRDHAGGVAQAAQTTPAALPADPAALLAALLEGLDTPGLDASCLDVDRMRTIGALLREATHGTVQLLQCRAAFKRELRAQVTTIQRRENNPLKFSPDATTALGHLLDPQSPGFRAPQDAMGDAFDDLRAHQIAVMAGMRAALDGLLERFSPPALERRIAPRGGLASLLPSARKAELWEQFSVLYGRISQEASDGFYDLLGSSFLKAYEAEARRLRKED
jgi:type VI secretion system FHA domain protein